MGGDVCAAATAAAAQIGFRATPVLAPPDAGWRGPAKDKTSALPRSPTARQYDAAWRPTGALRGLRFASQTRHPNKSGQWTTDRPPPDRSATTQFVVATAADRKIAGAADRVCLNDWCASSQLTTTAGCSARAGPTTAAAQTSRLPSSLNTVATLQAIWTPIC